MWNYFLFSLEWIIYDKFYCLLAIWLLFGPEKEIKPIQLSIYHLPDGRSSFSFWNTFNEDDKIGRLHISIFCADRTFLKVFVPLAILWVTGLYLICQAEAFTLWNNGKQEVRSSFWAHRTLQEVSGLIHQCS